MKKTDKFRNILKRRRRELIKAGFLPSTISMYISGDRIPKKEMAAKLAKTLDIPIEQIPSRMSIIK